MSSTTEHVEHAEAADHGHDEHHGHDGHVPSDSYFIRIALILALVTALETSTYWWGSWFDGNLDRAVVPALLIMMAIKFVMIVSVFMHLKFDSKVFSFMFYTGLVLAIFVYMVFLFTFQYFRS
jgi:cytochrome c oxidase subunit 4